MWSPCNHYTYSEINIDILIKDHNNLTKLGKNDFLI